MPFLNPFKQRAPVSRSNDSQQHIPGVVHVSSDELVQYRLQARDIKLDRRPPVIALRAGRRLSRFMSRACRR